MTEVEVLRWALYILSGIATTIGAALIGLIIWNAKAVMRVVSTALKELGDRFSRLELTVHDEIRYFESRLSRLEAINGLKSPVRRREGDD